MLKRILKRHRLTALAFFLLLCLVLIPFILNMSTKKVALPPAPAILESAIVTSQGVKVNWLTNESAKDTVSGYSIEASAPGKPFKEIARVEPYFTSYLDPTGSNAAYR